MGDVPALKQSIGVGVGWAWFAAAVTVALAAAVLVLGTTWWWAFAALEAVASQAVIATSWQDAQAETVVNVRLLVVAALGFAAHGPGSYEHQWQERPETALTAAPRSLHATFSGRIRSGQTSPGCRSPAAR